VYIAEESAVESVAHIAAVAGVLVVVAEGHIAAVPVVVAVFLVLSVSPAYRQP
jgi:hypothetical protein